MFCEILTVFLFSLAQAMISTGFAILLALPLTHFCFKFDFFGKKIFIALAVMLCIMPTKLVAICITLFYGDNFGIGFTGIILSHLMLNVPFAFYIISSGYHKFDITLLWLAQEAGASGWRCYKDIILPLLKPTIISAFLLLFLLHFASFSIPLILGNSAFNSTPEISVYNLYSSGDSFMAFWVWLLRLLFVLPVFFWHSKHVKKEIKVSSVPVILPKEKFNFFNKSAGKCHEKYAGKTFGKSFIKSGFVYLAYFIFILIITVGPLIALLVNACDIKVFEFLASIFSCNCDPIIGVCVYHVILNSIILACTSAFGAVFFACFACFVELKLARIQAKPLYLCEISPPPVRPELIFDNTYPNPFALSLTKGIKPIKKTMRKKIYNFVNYLKIKIFSSRQKIFSCKKIFGFIPFVRLRANGLFVFFGRACVKSKQIFAANIISFIAILPFIIGSVGVGIIFAYLYDLDIVFGFGLKNCKLFWPFLIGLLSHIFLNYAFAYRIIRAQVILYHPDFTKTAQACGANAKKAIFTVALPFIFPAIAKAFCICYGLSLTEVGAGAILQGKIGLTMPMAIRIYRNAGCQPAVIGLSLVLLCLTVLLTYLFSGFFGNGFK